LHLSTRISTILSGTVFGEQVKGYLKKAVYDNYQYFYYPNLEPGIYRILEAEYTIKILHTDEVVAPLPVVSNIFRTFRLLIEKGPPFGEKNFGEKL
jgi:hypothetical protein